MKLPINIRIFFANLFGEERFCYSCGRKMKAISIAYNNLNNSDCMVYQCPKCSSTLYSPIDPVEEDNSGAYADDLEDFVGEDDQDFGDLADSLVEMNREFESQNKL